MLFSKKSDRDSMDTQKLDVHIRWMIRRDMPQVLKIEQWSFNNPWHEQDFINELKQRNTIGMVACNDGLADGDVLGYMIYELHSKQNHFFLKNIAVHPQYRHKEVGTQLIRKLIGKLTKDRYRHIVATVCEHNLSAQSFFRSQNFRCESVWSDYYVTVEADAYIFKYHYWQES